MPKLDEEKAINFRLEMVRQAMAEEDLPKLTAPGKPALEIIRKEMCPSAEKIRKKERPEARVSDFIPTKIVERETKIQENVVEAPPVKCKPKRRSKYDTQELFEKLARRHQKIANSLRADKRQSAKRRYHEVLAENFAFIANRGPCEEDDNLLRIPPMFKGALILTQARSQPRYY